MNATILTKKEYKEIQKLDKMLNVYGLSLQKIKDLMANVEVINSLNNKLMAIEKSIEEISKKHSTFEETLNLISENAAVGRVNNEQTLQEIASEINKSMVELVNNATIKD